MKEIRKLRIWCIPQLPMKVFYWRVNTLVEAKNMIAMLDDYNQFQYENKIKPDYSDAGGLEVFDTESGDNGEWEEWEDEEGRSIDDIEMDELIENSEIRQ